MLRTYLLSFYGDLLAQDLNRPDWQMVQRTFYCNLETGTPSVTIRFMPATEHRVMKHKRYIKSFVLDPTNNDADQLMSDPMVRVIDSKQYNTSVGVVLIIDYEMRNKGGAEG